jgi:NAD(P)-dependent dehydrogenase (short-subunit alcohol dehydrogenase family)
MALLDGKVAIVTGAGRGIGREHALHLARAGAKIVVNDLGAARDGTGADEGPAHDVVKEIEELGGEAIVNGANVADFAAAGEMIQQAIDHFGQLDILVNNAGILRDRMIVNMTEDEWDAVINVHLKGTFGPLHHAARYWRDRSKAGEAVRGRIINTSSSSGLFGNVGQGNYGAAKAGIAGLTMVTAQELGRYGVTVNCLSPSARTRMTEDLGGGIAQAPTEGFDPAHPSHNSKIIVALCADEAQNITGQVFHVRGGAVNCLTPWWSGELFYSDEGWDPETLLEEIVERFPDGKAPAGMRATGQAVSTPAGAAQNS